MCDQCVVNPIYFGEPLPGYTLARARRGGSEEWQKGEWALIQVNNPTFAWINTPTPCIGFGKTDEEYDHLIQTLAKDSPERERMFFRPIDFEFALQCDPINGYRLVLAGIERGFDPNGIDRFHHWLFDYLGEWLKTAVATTEEDPFSNLETDYPTDLSIERTPMSDEKERVEIWKNS